MVDGVLCAVEGEFCVEGCAAEPEGEDEPESPGTDAAVLVPATVVEPEPTAVLVVGVVESVKSVALEPELIT